MKRIKINVTKTDIRKGKQADPECCAIALACRRQLSEDFGFRSVTNRRVLSDNFIEGAHLPAIARTFIEKFDEKKSSVEPFSFRLEIPDEGETP